MSRWCPLCRWWILAPLALALSLLGTIGGCALVERDLTSRSQALLQDRGIDDVSVDFEFRNATLRGPEARRDAALEVNTLEGVRSAEYIAADVEPTTGEAATVDTTASFDGTRMVLTGSVASEEQRTRLVDAATAAVGAENVDDQLTVDGAASTPSLDGAVGQLADLIAAAPKSLSAGAFRLDDLDLNVSGVSLPGRLAPVNEVVKAAQAEGLTVINSIVGGTATAPTPAPAPAVQERLDELLRGTTIQFATASADITTDSKTILDKAARVMRPALRGNSRLSVSVDGHTDDQGDAGRNQELSERRAEAVLQYLATAGVPRARLSAIGYGESKPVASNGTDSGRRANRRIEFTVTGA